MGIVSFGSQIAGITFPPLVVFLISSFGWRTTWWIFAVVIAVVATPLCWILVKDKPTNKHGEIEGASAVAENLSIRDVFSNTPMLVMAFSFLTTQIALQAIIINLASISASRGIGNQGAALIAALFASVAIVSKLGAGLAADRFGYRAPMIVIGMSVTLGLVVTTFTSGTIWMGIGYALVAAAGAQWTLMAAVSAAEFSKNVFGRAFGYLSMIAPVAGIGPVGLAVFQEQTGTYGGGLAALSTLSTLSIILPFVCLKGGARTKLQRSS
jgi:MFS family permease